MRYFIDFEVVEDDDGLTVKYGNRRGETRYIKGLSTVILCNVNKQFETELGVCQTVTRLDKPIDMWTIGCLTKSEDVVIIINRGGGMG